MNHRFHYESEKQAQQWLALHEAYSPARTDTECLATYHRAFADVATMIDAAEVSLISIGCGGGQKDLALLKSLHSPRINYVPSDVSLPLSLTAHLRASKEISTNSNPLVLDFPATRDLPEFLKEFLPSPAKRLFAFFGMLPNFESGEALEPLSAALQKDDLLLLSANLAPGTEYESGVKKILPLYENDLTRRWLATALLDAGLDISPSNVEFSIAPVNDLLRIEANYRFRKKQTIRLDREEFSYAPGEIFRLLFSYRHTPDRLRAWLAKYRIEIVRQWITASQEEGVFLCKRIA
jgi:L-histidine N-alpha-methyltransferase